MFNNANDAELLSEVWPAVDSSGAILLVTDRDTSAKTPFYQIQDGINLPPLNGKEAAKLLLKLTWRENKPKECELNMKIAKGLESFSAHTDADGWSDKAAKSFLFRFSSKIGRRRDSRLSFQSLSLSHLATKILSANVRDMIGCKDMSGFCFDYGSKNVVKGVDWKWGLRSYI